MPETSEYYNLSKVKYRAIIYDYLALAVSSDVQRLYCLTDFQVAWLRSNLPYYTWRPRWEHQDATPTELEKSRAELELALMSCLVFSPAQLEYIYEREMEKQLGVFDALYDEGGIPGLNENTPTDFYSGDDSDERLNALCSACNIYVRSYINNWVGKAQVALGFTIIASIVASITVVGGVIAGTVLASLALITHTALEAMQDEDAINDVVCCMRDSLVGSVVNAFSFEYSLDSCAFPVGSNQAIIRDIVASDLGVFDNWLSFLNSLGDSFVLAENGVVSCPCPEEDTILVTFGGGGYAYTTEKGVIDNAFGNPLPSMQAVPDGGDTMRVLVRVDLPTNSNTVTNVNADYYLTATFAGYQRRYQAYDSDDNLISNQGASGGDRNVWIHMDWDVNLTEVAYLKFESYRTAILDDPIFIDNLEVTFTPD